MNNGDIADLYRLVDTLRHRIIELEQRADTLELDQEVLWDDMQTRQKAAEMFPQELQNNEPSSATATEIRMFGFGA